MKTKTDALTYSTALIISLFSLFITPAALWAQSAKDSKVEKVNKVDKTEHLSYQQETTDESQKAIKAKVDVEGRPNLDITVYDAQTEILPARNNAIEVQLIYQAEGKDADLLKVEKALKKYILSKNGNNISVSSQFYSSFISSTNTPISSQISIKLKDGTKVQLTKFKINTIKIFVPSELDISIDAKYCAVDIDFSIHGNLNIKGYDIELKGKRVSEKTIIDSKYSKLKLGELNSTQLKGYETKFYAKSIKALNLDCKFSEIEIDQIGKLTYKGYEDDLELYEVEFYKADTKFSKIELASVKTIESKMYEGSLEVLNCENALLEGKYTDYDFETISSINIINGYENNFDVTSINKFASSNCKYSKYELEILETSLIDTLGYENKINIEQLNDKFSLIAVNGKHIELNLDVSNCPNFILLGNVRYPGFNFNSVKLTKEYHNKENSTLDFLYYRGKKNHAHKIRVGGYEVDVNLANH